MQITTNNVPRNIVYGYDLPAKARAQFDWMETEELDCAEFVEYRGRWYALSEFMWIEPPVSDNAQFDGRQDWHGYHSDSFFSGVLIRLSDDGESVTMATYYS